MVGANRYLHRLARSVTVSTRREQAIELEVLTLQTENISFLLTPFDTFYG